MRKFEEKYLRTNNFSADSYITPELVKGCIDHLYETLDIIDLNLKKNGVGKFSFLVERANLSSVVGNIIGAGFEIYSNGDYYRNAPNTYPDLLPKGNVLPGIEIKTAIGRNAPKGHHGKEGEYFILRYSLTNESGIIMRDEENNDTVTIWEVKSGYLDACDFTYSNTENDSGKTATIKLSKLDKLPLLFFDHMACPYKQHSLDNPYSGYN